MNALREILRYFRTPVCLFCGRPVDPNQGTRPCDHCRNELDQFAQEEPSHADPSRIR